MDSDEDQDDEASDQPLEASARIDLEWIVVGKKAGLSFAEMNELRVRDLAVFVDVMTGKTTARGRTATQKDIDKFYGG